MGPEEIQNMGAAAARQQAALAAWEADFALQLQVRRGMLHECVCVCVCVCCTHVYGVCVCVCVCVWTVPLFRTDS